MLIQTKLELTLRDRSRAARGEVGLCEGAGAIHQTTYEIRERAFPFSADDEGLEAEESSSDCSPAVLAIAMAALLLALLPAAIGMAILLGTTLPLEFGAGAAIAILGGVKIAAWAAGLVAAIREPRPAWLPVSNL